LDTSAHHQVWEQLREAEAAVEREYRDLPVRLEALEGDPVYVLADVSAHAGLIVLGRHERRADPARGAGDVARGVLIRARCPVVVVASTH